MENITFVKYRRNSVPLILLIAVLFVFGITPTFADVPKDVSSKSNEVLAFGHDIGIASKVDGNELKYYWSPFLVNSFSTSNKISAKRINSVDIELNPKNGFHPNSGLQLRSEIVPPTDSDGDGVTNVKENEDGTNPNDSCDFILAHQNSTPSSAWKNADCDGDGVTNYKEKQDGTDPLDSCDFILAHQNCTPSSAWKNADCDGDGVTNDKEKIDGTDPLDSCDFILAHQNCTPSSAWKNADCDGDGVTNDKEKTDGTDPLDSCDFILAHQNCTPSSAWKNADCDGDGVTNDKEKQDGTDPLDSCDFILAHQNCTPTSDWKNSDCDGDGVTNEDEKTDGTDPLDPCDYVPAHVTLAQSGDYLTADCDGDGVTNEKEIEDGADPKDSCDFVLEHQTVDTSNTWNGLDCDGDGVTNEDEKTDGTDPLDPCDYNPAHVTLAQSGDYLTADCDGDGVTNEKEIEDGTDPKDSCDFVLEHQTVDTSNTWNGLDCDGDGVTNEDEKTDGTDPLDPCDYDPAHVTLVQSGAYLTADCDGDGVTNEKEIEDGTDPKDSCDFVLEHQTVDTSNTWNGLDCDGDGVTNEDEKTDGTDPLDPCDYNPESITLTPSPAWESLDCDGDGNPNGTDPDPLVATARDDSGSTPALTEVVINILENDDYLPNSNPSNLGITSLTMIGGSALGTVSFDAETGFVTYTPVESESNSTITIIYQVCNVIPDPNVCASATVTIQVGPDMDNILDAVDDTYTVETGVSGVIPDSNVLDNDTLNGDPVLPTDVVLTSTPTDELTINEDGSVSVAPGTEDGTYTIDYTICEAANTDNCDSGTVTIQVGPDMGNILDAVDDTYTVETGVSGVIPDSNVLDNDTLNGEPVLPTDVVLTSTPTEELTINEDGSVSVAPGTADGTYTIDYTICEAANTDNCDSGTVTIQVGPDMDNVLDAVDDTYTVETGVSGVIPDSNVLDNDTLNGDPVLPTDVVLTSTPTDELTINEDGSVSVAPGTADGTYTIDYTICEAANTDNCDSGTVTIQVGPDMDNILDAVDDTYTTDTDNSGVIPNSNVLDNDTLNGDPVLPTVVVLTSTPTEELTINEDGSVSVAPGTEDGTYTIDYTICEVANAENCDAGTVTVIVELGDEDEKIEVNQLVTPNSDGKNDFLFIRGVKNAHNNTIKIFNRWGAPVYEGKGYNNQNNVFDGRSKTRSTVTGNSYLPAGVYYYIFQYENKQKNITDSGYIYVSK